MLPVDFIMHEYLHTYFENINKKAQLTPWLARDSVAIWRISLKFFFAAAIEALTCAAT